MSGIETAMLVAGIVSAFSGATTLFREWRKQRRERRESKANKELNSLVKKSGPDVQNEYDIDFRRLGRVFARGDDIGRNALMQQLLIMQQTVITLLTESRAHDTLRNVIHPDHDTVYRTSSAVRSDTLCALGQQAQRLAQAAPVERPLETPPSALSAIRSPQDTNGGYNCQNSLEDQGVGKYVGYKGYSFEDSKLRAWKCTSCNWGDTVRHFQPLTRDGLGVDVLCFLVKFHRKGDTEYDTLKYRCFICKTGKRMNAEDMAKHCMRHEWNQICDGMCPNPSGRCGVYLRSPNQTNKGYNCFKIPRYKFMDSEARNGNAIAGGHIAGVQVLLIE